MCAWLCAIAVAAASTEPPLDRAAAQWVQQTLKKLTLDEKVGQLLVPSLTATFTSADSEAFVRLRHLVRDLKIGGIHVFGPSEPMPALMLLPSSSMTVS